MNDSEYALLARFEANDGQEAALGVFLKDALAMAREEPGMTTRFALQFDELSFDILTHSQINRVGRPT
jgi:hypothetical protein